MALDSQDFSNILNSVLAATTVWLGFATHSTARATRQSVELQSRPYFSIDGIEINKGREPITGSEIFREFINVSILISNPGQVLVNYEIEEFKVSYKDETIDNPAFLTLRSVLHPKANSRYFYPSIFMNNQLTHGSGVVSVKIGFWSTLHTVHHVTAIINFQWQSTESGTPDWRFSNGPIYS
jgi:hypothetical protein